MHTVDDVEGFFEPLRQQQQPPGYGYPPQYPQQQYPQQYQQPYPPQYGAPPPGYGYGYAPPPKKGPPKALLIGGGAFVAVILGVVIVYFAVFYYSPVALHHIPAGTTAAVRLDFVDVALFAPVRRNLIPLIDEPSKTAPAQAKSRTDRIADAVGFSPSRDLREAVICFVGGVDKIVIIVGGNIPKGKLVAGLLEVAKQENDTDWIDGGGVMKSKYGGIVIGQADDGSAIVGTDENSVRAAIPETQEAARLGVPTDGSVTYAFTGDVWKQLANGPYASVLQSVAALKQLDSGNGHLTLSNSPQMVTQQLVASGVNVEDAKASLYRVFTDLRRVSELRRKVMNASQDFAGEEQALAQSVIESKPPNILKITTTWPYDGLDRGSQSLAQKIRTLKSTLGTPPQPAGNIQIPGLPGLQLPIPIPGVTQ